jgi:enterochelin esterase-like enzyme
MKKILILIIIIGCSITYSQDEVRLRLIVYSHLPDSLSEIFITGNVPELGNWDPGFHKMNKLNDSTWQSEIKIQVETNLEFKFTLGNWNTEALNDDKSIPKNHIVKLFSDSTLKFYINYWANQTNRKFDGQITGEVKYHRDFGNSQLIPKRDIIVWLPPGYEIDSLKRYLVLYMQDGQNIVDPATSSFGVDWQVDENADTLIKKGFINPIIIVGIYNTRFRGSEYGINDTSKEYKIFVVNELKPFIDSNYRTKPEAEFNAVAGSSLGGLIAFELVWEYPNEFSKCACVSPAFDIDRYDYVTVVQNSESDKKHIQIYIDIGGKGIDTELKSGTEEMISVLKQKGFEENKDLFYEFYPEAAHSEKDWSKRVWKILIQFFGTEKGKSLL